MAHRKYIPVDDINMIDYQGKVLLIEPDENGNTTTFQADGILIKTVVIQGFVIGEFKTTNKWFSPEWWVRKAYWFIDEGLLYFTYANMDRDPGHQILNNERNHKVQNQRLQEEIKPKTRRSDICLTKIINEANKQLGLNLKFPYLNRNYGVNWYEACVPVMHNGVECLLTWENSD